MKTIVTAEQFLRNKLESEIASFGDGTTEFHTRDLELLLKCLDEKDEIIKKLQFISTEGETERKELSEISDEHILEMLHICLENIFVTPTVLTKTEFVRNDEDFGIIAFGEEMRIGFTVEDTGNTGLQFQLSIDDAKSMYINIPQLIQFLQFKGYKVPQYYPVSPQVHDSSETKGKEEI